MTHTPLSKYDQPLGAPPPTLLPSFCRTKHKAKQSSWESLQVLTSKDDRQSTRSLVPALDGGILGLGMANCSSSSGQSTKAVSWMLFINWNLGRLNLLLQRSGWVFGATSPKISGNERIQLKYFLACVHTRKQTDKWSLSCLLFLWKLELQLWLIRKTPACSISFVPLIIWDGSNYILKKSASTS